MIVAVHNPKGGVGKTTTAVNLATSLACSGRSVLLVDLEADMNASISVGVRPTAASPSIFDLLLRHRRAADVIRSVPRIPNLHLITGGPDLADIGAALRHARQPERRLSDVLRPLASAFDVILVDSPADYGVLPLSAPLAADHLVVPVRAEYLSLESLAHLLRWYRQRRQARRAIADFTGIVLTRVDHRRQATREIVDIIRLHNRRGVFRTEIPEDPRVMEAPSHGVPFILYAPRTRAAQAYEQLAREIRGRITRRRR